MNLNTLDLNLLLVFDAVLRTGSTTLAGEELGLTQSAVSNGLRRLRAAFDDPLFIKTPQGMSPTPMAERLAPSLREGLDRIRQALDDREDFLPAASQRQYVLYASDTGQRVFLPRLLGRLRREAPGIQLVTLQASPRDAPRLMAAGFYRQKLFSDHYVCMAAADHPAIQAPMTLAQYMHAPHVVYRPAVGSHAFFEDVIDKLFSEHNLRRQVVLQVTHGLGLPEIIAGTDMLVAVPASLAQACAGSPGVRFLPLPFDAPLVDITQQWHERFHRDLGHAWLRRTIADLFQDGGAAPA